jgi:ADP-heptose:LPS heptosyltransferase
MYRSTKDITRTPLNVNFNSGGIGDCIAALPAIKYMANNFPVDIFLYVPDYFLEIAKNALSTTAVSIRPFSRGKELWNAKFPARVMANGPTVNITSMGTSLVDTAFTALCDKQVDIAHKNYLQINFKRANVDLRRFNLPKEYVILTTGYTASVREWPAKHVNDTAAYLVSRGITPVFLGNKQTHIGVDKLENGVNANIVGRFNEQIDFTRGVNLIEQTSLMEAAAIISKSKALLGVDNGLTHLAAMCGDVPIIIGYTTVRPEHRLPIRHNTLGWNIFTVTPDASLKCRFCQSNWEFVYNHDFRNCYYVEKKVDSVIQCTSQMTAAKFIKHLDGIL